MPRNGQACEASCLREDDKSSLKLQLPPLALCAMRASFYLEGQRRR